VAYLFFLFVSKIIEINQDNQSPHLLGHPVHILTYLQTKCRDDCT